METRPDHTAVRPGLPLMTLGLVILSWGAGPVVTKLVTVHPMVGTVLRFGLAVPLLYVLVRLRDGRLTMPIVRKTALPGIAFGINLIFVFAAVQEVTIAVLAVTIALQPALLLLVAGPMFDERPTAVHVAWTLVGVLGAAAVILGAGQEFRASPLGLAYCIAALLTFSVYFVLTRLARSTVDVDPVEWMAGINLWSLAAALSCAVFVVTGDELAEVDRTDVFWLLILAYVTGVFGHVLMSWVHGYIEAARSSLYIQSMHLVAVGLAWLVHDEPFTPVQMVGGVVVLLAVAAVLRLPPRSEPVAGTGAASAT
ncbi:MAG: DMT family transporter [Actinomycetota bacterium]